MELRDKAALITGASRGLGEALARALSREGARLALVARDRAPLERLAAQIRAEGGKAHALAADVGDKQAIYPLAGSAAALLGPIDLVIHNASTLGPLPMPLLLDTECEELEKVLAVNLVGPFRLTRALAGSMLLRKQGLIVHISSDAAVSAYPRWGAYGVSKAALDHLARSWDAELSASGVRSISIDPGEMNTRMHSDALPDADPAKLADPREVAERIVRILRRADALGPAPRLSAADEAAP